MTTKMGIISVQRGIILVFNVINLFALSFCFNLDFEYTVLKTGPKHSSFGFSVAQHQENANKWLLVGAPQANNSFLQVPGSKDKASGTVFKCSATDPSFDCIEEIRFDTQPSGSDDSKSNEWLGVSLKSRGKDKTVMACAHRYEYYGAKRNFRLLEGKCFEVTSTFRPHAHYNPCRFHNDDRSSSPKPALYAQCQTGIGMDPFPEPESSGLFESLFGATGAKQFSGRLFKMDNDDNSNEFFQPDEKSYFNSYFAFSVALGNYLSSNELDIASGGPRFKSFGTVLIYQKSNLNKIYQMIPENTDEIQLASGFGIAICSVDFDNNGLTELVVGAPFHAPEDNKDQADTGMVYIYHKPDGKNKLVLQKTLLGMQGFSNFGYAVANAGDLNNDGFNDLIVGAPHENKGSGAVYVYQGSKTGLVETLSQKIDAMNIQSGLSDNIGLKGFGRSLAAGIDMDSNGYPDVLVGAYASNQAVLLRGRPLIHTYQSLEFMPKDINVTNKPCLINNRDTTCFSLTFCHNFSEPLDQTKNPANKTVDIRYTIIADPLATKARVLFFSTGTNKLSFYVKSNTATKCEVFKKLYIDYNKDGTVAEYPDITFLIQHELPYGNGADEIKKPARSNTSIPSLDTYPVLVKTITDGKFKTGHQIEIDLPFKRECTDCIPDLSMMSEAYNYTLRLGSKTFRFNITLENNGRDPAFAVGFKFSFSEKLELAHIVIGKNKKIFCQQNICEDVFNKFRQGDVEEVGVVLNTRNFTSERNISIEVTSANKEDDTTLHDNKIGILFDLKVVADVQILPIVSTQIVYRGEIKGESVTKSLESAGQVVEHKYAIRNNGPDLLPKANVTIKWPYLTLSGKHLLYLVKVSSSSRNLKCDPPSFLNELKLKSDGSSPSLLRVPASSKSFSSAQIGSSDEPGEPTEQVGRRRNRRDVGNSTSKSEQPKRSDNKVVNRKKHGIILDCEEGTAKCLTITCTVENLEAGLTNSITVNSRLWEASLLLDYYGEVLTIVSHGMVQMGINASYISDPDHLNNDVELYTVINPEFAKKAKETGIKEWQIALAAVAGILLLALLIFGLYKIGFFKRKRTAKYKKNDEESDKRLLSKEKNGYN